MRSLALGAMLCSALLIGCSKGSQSSPRGIPQPASANDPSAMEPLKGTWQVISIVAGGTPVPVERVQKLQLQYVFNGNSMTVRRPDRPDDTKTISVDGRSQPKRLTSTSNPPIRAIYAIEGNQLRLCIMVDENLNAGYPTEFASKASPTTDLVILERR